MFITEDGEEIRVADFAAGIVEGTATGQYVGMTKVISVRLPVHLAIQLQAMAHKSGKTRNAMISKLLEVGLEEVRLRLSDETCEELQVIEIELHHDEFGQKEEA